ncbi:hypothetical protein J1614_006985 [Plenodomus biglobosus]|nr:hypothetical protein J1614_006985 [Plenodomus biglobosus]
MSVTQKSARATIEAYYKRAVAANSQWLKDREADAKQDFENKYSACKKDSLYHDLQCGHRVQTEYSRECGISCAQPTQGRPLICTACIVDVVRAEVALEELSITQSSNTTMTGVFSTKEEKVKKFADLYVSRELREGYGRCKVVQKLEDARMQFFEAFMQEDGFGGVEDQQEASPPRAPDQNSARKLPGNTVQKQIRALGAGKKDRVQHARIGKQQPWRPNASSGPRNEHKADPPARTPQRGADSMCAKSENKDESINVLLKQFAEARVDLPPEDQATEAVRQAMEKFSM